MPDIDFAARKEALEKWVMPESLHLPVAARDKASIANYVGEIVRDLSGGNKNKAFLVHVETPKTINKKLAVWKLSQSHILHKTMQVWVHVKYNAYRKAYIKAFPDEDLTDLVLDHIWNRRMSEVMGYMFVRLIPISRGANSSSGTLAEQWALDYQSTPEMRKINKKKEKYQFIQYADLHSLVKMLSIKTGGGVMDVVNDAQTLLREI
ncbi:hypothetical protein [Desulfogranum marinum]|uniref:hypothetical protein n=1 Tax=Desulfogranum marinum TaxID=453220 RepID=UPI0029C626F7|nr:hypothetical protein [Desulfogranum marinum]